MKPLLMHSDQEFDPHQMLKNSMYRLRNSDAPKPSRDEQALIQDLELETLIQSMAAGDEFLIEVSRLALLRGMQNNVETILYRQDALKDSLRHPDVVLQLYRMTGTLIEDTRRRWFDLTSSYPSSLLYSSVDVLGAVLDTLRTLRGIAEKHADEFTSAAFRGLFDLVRREFPDEYLAVIQAHLTELRFRKGVLMSAQIGSSDESINLVLRKPPDIKRGWRERLFRKRSPSYSFRLAPRDETGGRILSAMRDGGITKATIAMATSANHVLAFFRSLRTELAFYVACLNLHNRLTAKQEPSCFPTPVIAGKLKHRFGGLYDVCLSLRTAPRVIGNAVDGDDKRLVVITGANQGGKSTFLRSVGLAQVMMQAGMFVCATFFEAAICPALYTHYKREEDAALVSGKLDEEIARMSDIVDHLVPHAIILFNESFAATNEREGSEIAGQIVSALLEKRIRVFYVTHLYAFARSFFDEGRGDALFLRAEREPDGARTFQLIEGQPRETSYGEDLYREVFSGKR